MELRDKIRVLANKRGMSLTDLEVALGFGNGTIVRWNKSSPTAEKLKKTADFLEVSVDYLLDGTEKAPVQKDKRVTTSDENIKFALWGDSSEIDDEDLEDVKRYAAFIKERKRDKQ